jgi:hypothetical protein
LATLEPAAKVFIERSLRTAELLRSSINERAAYIRAVDVCAAGDQRVYAHISFVTLEEHCRAWVNRPHSGAGPVSGNAMEDIAGELDRPGVSIVQRYRPGHGLLEVSVQEPVAALLEAEDVIPKQH